MVPLSFTFVLSVSTALAYPFCMKSYQVGYTHLPKQHVDSINCLHPGEVNRRIGGNVEERSFYCDITNSMEWEPESSLSCSQKPNMYPIPEPDKCSPHAPILFCEQAL
jgi:hypothetical protein